MHTLYVSPGACSLAAHIAIHEAGLPFSLRILNFGKNEQQSQDYLALNPKGRVPALVTEQGTLTETSAILLYIAQMAPEKKLAPLDDPFALARMQGFNSFLATTVHVNHAHGRRATRWADEPTSIEDMKRKVPATMRDAFQLIEDGLLVGPYVLGEEFSVADSYLYVMSSWLRSDGVDIAEFPRVQAHFERMKARPAVQKALAAEAAA
ncbi:glutathione S-transferase family protein [Rhizobium sp. SSA_523]|uniref:glutathione S-transferase family protein n=1 Tax=Rhizobium sp. SSA_523 TaxID=2952477 RepID=UPI002090B6D5|nr:glutathione S-transferase family protein [Rhizobium sp. SSA_523]MCO5730978.1 glutathione S-transferase family protein [Rhizobium sp. SSA_523]WKC24214.1 glutathione S-transferase family protein [Rhizobium sp. SSA_523]